MGARKEYSVGVVAKDLEVSDNGKVQLYPKDILPHVDGSLTDTDSIKATVSKSGGGIESVEVDTSFTIEASWLNIGGSNKQTPPLLKKGETVQVHKAYDTDQYFWTTMRNETDLRRRETILHMVGNTDTFDEPLDTDNTYWMLMDTINKRVRLKTNMNDGELASYDLDFNTRTGNMSITDNNGYGLSLNSLSGTLTLTATNIILAAYEGISFSGGSISGECKSMDLKASGEVKLSSDGDMKIKSKSFKQRSDSSDVSISKDSVTSARTFTQYSHDYRLHTNTYFSVSRCHTQMLFKANWMRYDKAIAEAYTGCSKPCSPRPCCESTTTVAPPN